MKSLLCSVLFWSLSASSLNAQGFTFWNTFRAGTPGGDWQLGIGDTSNASSDTSTFAWNSRTRTWRADGSQDFEIGWRAGTNTAYVTVWNEAAAAAAATDSTTPTPTTVSFVNTGTRLSSNATWTIPGEGIWSAIRSNPNNAASIAMTVLSVSPNTSVGGVLPSLSISRAAGEGGVSGNVSAPIVIQAASNGGDWYLRGTILFTGLQGQSGGGLTRSNSQLFFQAVGSDTPEASSFVLLGGGLFAVAWLNRKRQNLGTV